MGPYSLEEVNRQLATGSLSPSDQGWYEGAAEWTLLSSVPGVVVPGAPTSMTSSFAGTAIVQQPAMDYAGFWFRVVAYVIDGILLGIVAMILNFFFRGSVDEGGTGSPLAAVLEAVLSFAYMTGMWSSSMQASLGQKVCGLKVVRSADGSQISFLQAVGRYFALILAFMIFFIGVIMVAFTERKQGLHDMLAGTYVVKAR